MIELALVVGFVAMGGMGSFAFWTMFRMMRASHEQQVTTLAQADESRRHSQRMLDKFANKILAFKDTEAYTRYRQMSQMPEVGGNGEMVEDHAPDIKKERVKELKKGIRQVERMISMQQQRAQADGEGPDRIRSHPLDMDDEGAG